MKCVCAKMTRILIFGRCHWCIVICRNAIFENLVGIRSDIKMSVWVLHCTLLRNCVKARLENGFKFQDLKNMLNILESDDDLAV